MENTLLVKFLHNREKLMFSSSAGAEPYVPADPAHMAAQGR